MVMERQYILGNSSNQMRLLIIEDDRESADYLVKAFREVGHVAELASDGEEGLSLADGGEHLAALRAGDGRAMVTERRTHLVRFQQSDAPADH
jgi:DNA-binding response OmpR family regulator